MENLDTNEVKALFDKLPFDFQIEFIDYLKKLLYEEQPASEES